MSSDQRSSVCSAAVLFLDLLNRVTAELWLHNFNEFCCVGVCNYNSGYFSPDYSHLLAFASGADAPTDSGVKFLWLVCFAAMMERETDMVVEKKKKLFILSAMFKRVSLKFLLFFSSLRHISLIMCIPEEHLGCFPCHKLTATHQCLS